MGVGRCLPDAGFVSLAERVADVRAPWLAEADVVAFALCSHLASPAGLQLREQAMPAPECPLSHELLRSSLS